MRATNTQSAVEWETRFANEQMSNRMTWMNEWLQALYEEWKKERERVQWGREREKNSFIYTRILVTGCSLTWVTERSRKKNNPDQEEGTERNKNIKRTTRRVSAGMGQVRRRMGELQGTKKMHSTCLYYTQLFKWTLNREQISFSSLSSSPFKLFVSDTSEARKKKRENKEKKRPVLREVKYCDLSNERSVKEIDTDADATRDNDNCVRGAPACVLLTHLERETRRKD